MLARHWVARISILTLAHVAGTVPIVSVMAMAPVIQSDLGLSVTEVGLLVSGYYFAQTIGAVPAAAWWTASVLAGRCSRPTFSDRKSVV